MNCPLQEHIDALEAKIKSLESERQHWECVAGLSKRHDLWCRDEAAVIEELIGHKADGSLRGALDALYAEYKELAAPKPPKNNC